MTPKQNIKQEKVLIKAHKDFNKELNSYASFKVSDSSLGKDLVQDTFQKTWSYLVKGKNIEIMKAFLYHILNNLIVNVYRKRKNKPASLDTLIDNGFEPSSDESEHFQNIFDGKRAVLLLENLPALYKKVIHMRYVQNLSFEEISRITNQSKNTVSVYLYRGIKRLKQIYQSSNDDIKK